MSINILIVEDVDNRITALGSAINEIKNEKIEIYPRIEEMDGFIKEMSAAAPTKSKLKEWTNHTLINYLDDNDIDLIILDFYLYKNEEKKIQEIDSSSGYKILEEIRESSMKHIPIFANSFKNDNLHPKDDSYLSTLNGFIDKKSSKDEYDDYFVDNKLLLNHMILLAENYKKEKAKSDIVVICALKKEIKPVVNLLDLKKDENDTSKILYIGDMEGKDKKKLKVVAVTKEQMGMAEAATLTTQMLEKYNPKFVVMTGIAAGIDSIGQNFLDILMPAYIHNWQSGKFKAIEDKTKTEEILHIFDREYSSVKTYIDDKAGISLEENSLKTFPENFLQTEEFEGDFDDENHVDTYFKNIQNKAQKKRNEFQEELCSLFKYEEAKIKKKIEKLKEQENSSEEEISFWEEQLQQLSEKELIRDFIKKFTEKLGCNIYKGGMVSGSAVVADGEIVKEYIDSRGINGIDMEAYGVTFACNHHPNKPNVLILKAICDFADETKNDIYQTAAAHVSAQAFIEMFKNNIEVE